MVAPGSVNQTDDGVRSRRRPWADDDSADWLPLQQAACELGISASTARRMIRRGQLRNRVVSRPGGFAYLVYLPNSRHAAFAASGRHRDRDLARGTWPQSAFARIEAQVGRVRRSLAGRLQPPATERPRLLAETAGPFDQYRWLARRRRWWSF